MSTTRRQPGSKAWASRAGKNSQSFNTHCGRFNGGDCVRFDRGADVTSVALFTSQDIGFDLVQHFAGRSDIDLLVVSYEKTKDSGYGYRSALRLCKERGIRHIDAPKADERVAQALTLHEPDIIVSAYYAKILPTELLSLARMGGINVHPGKLPLYKGRFPTPWYIINGEKTFGIAVHKMVEEVDAGGVYLQREFPIPPDMTGHQLLVETMRRSGDAIKDSFDDIVSGKVVDSPQIGQGSQYDHIDSEYEIDWSLPAEIINRHIRVHAPPYKPAYGTTDQGRIEISRASIVEAKEQPGKVIAIAPLTIACGKDALRVDL